MISDLEAFLEDLEMRGKEGVRTKALVALKRNEYTRLLALRGEKLLWSRRSTEFLMRGQYLIAYVEKARTEAAKAVAKRLLK